ncbi:hypothetical protein BS47DRAFT_1389399 [Hydnum rufescens UP504]|uniref:Uncharacterized protein n=1 Tax=Hydnum rufescens UP504 TaxID=1448309 RepID=A0A9P6E159_9AGAM|nr:hypothetical protein BS47DRAFT_1389399 [Hydnum rufescens UP504]
MFLSVTVRTTPYLPTISTRTRRGRWEEAFSSVRRNLLDASSGDDPDLVRSNLILNVPPSNSVPNASPSNFVPNSSPSNSTSNASPSYSQPSGTSSTTLVDLL